jgi:hypothetical protein
MCFYLSINLHQQPRVPPTSQFEIFTTTTSEIFLAAFLQMLFDKLLSPELLNFARQYERLGEKLGYWKKTLSRVQVVLDNADVNFYQTSFVIVEI